MALVSIACPSCGHRGAARAVSLPRTLQCIRCGHVHRFECLMPFFKQRQSTRQHRTRGQRIVTIAALELKAAARRQREHADDLT
jgi:hypothetical protein